MIQFPRDEERLATLQKLLSRPLVFTNGCFDLIHHGHVVVLQHAWRLTMPHGSLVVGLDDDASVRVLKGFGRPVMSLEARATLLEALCFTPTVVGFPTSELERLIDLLSPDVIVKGGDYSQDNVRGYDDVSVVIAPYDDRYSTTSTIRRILETCPRSRHDGPSLGR